MSKWVDVDALIDAHYEYCNEHSYNVNAVFPTWSLSLMQNAPSIDIVRCGECKFWNEGKCWNLKGLNKTDGIVNADDFCSYGEREGE